MTRNFSLCLCVALLCLCGCQKKAETNSWETYTYNRNDENNAQEVFFEFNGEVVLPTNKDTTSIDGKIRSILITELFGASYQDTKNTNLLTTFSDSCFQQYKAICNDIDEKMADIWWSKDEMKGQVYFTTDAFLCYKIETSSMERFMDQSAKRTEYINFNLLTGSWITVDSLFDHTQMQPLTEALETEFDKQMENIKKPDREEYEHTFAALRPTDNFAIDEQGIHFFYNPFELTSYSVGSVTLSLDWQQIMPLLKSDNVVYQYAKQQINI